MPTSCLDESGAFDEFGIQNLSPEPVAFAPPGIDITGFGYTGHPQWIPNGATDTVTAGGRRT